MDPKFPMIDEIKAKILQVVKDVYGNVWPEDEWFELSRWWDVNIWFDSGEKRATIYPIHWDLYDNRNTITDKGIGILFDEEE